MPEDRKPRLADQLDTVTLEDLAANFPMTGDVAKFREMTASKRAEYSMIVLERRAVGMKPAAPSNDELDGLSPEARLSRILA